MYRHRPPTIELEVSIELVSTLSTSVHVRAPGRSPTTFVFRDQGHRWRAAEFRRRLRPAPALDLVAELAIAEQDLLPRVASTSHLCMCILQAGGLISRETDFDDAERVGRRTTRGPTTHGPTETRACPLHPERFEHYRWRWPTPNEDAPARHLDALRSAGSCDTIEPCAECREADHG